MLLKLILLSIIVLMALQNKVSGDVLKKLPSPLKVGMSIQIEARSPWFDSEYKINLLQQSLGIPNFSGNLELQMSVNFRTYGNDTIIDLINLQDGERQGDVRHNFDWFIPYTIQIFARKDHWEILLDEVKPFIFKYKKQIEGLETIKYLFVEGGIRTELITF